MKRTASRLLLRRFRFGPGERYRTAAERLAKLDLSTLKSRRPQLQSPLFATRLSTKKRSPMSSLRSSTSTSRRSSLISAKISTSPVPKLQPSATTDRTADLSLLRSESRLVESESDYLIENFDRISKDDRTGSVTIRNSFIGSSTRLAEQDFRESAAGIPFLNGGFSMMMNLSFLRPSCVFATRRSRDLFEDLLEAYNFTVREDTPLSQEVAVDPEMLGKIFESIVLHAEAPAKNTKRPTSEKRPAAITRHESSCISFAAKACGSISPIGANRCPALSPAKGPKA